MQNAAMADPARARGEPEGSADPRSLGGPGSDAASSREQLDYLSDMLLELKALADRAGRPTLGLLLELASREARAGESGEEAEAA